MSWNVDVDIEAVVNTIREGAADGLKSAADSLLDASRQQVPDDTGALRASGKSAVDRENLEAGVGYGGDGETAAYAEKQHEDYSLHHDDGNAGFLNLPFMAMQDELLAKVAEGIKGRLG